MTTTIPIFVVVREDQNEHGFIDTSIAAAYTHEGRAADAVRELEQFALDAGERVSGREDEWRDRQTGATGADWEVCFGYEETTLERYSDNG